MSSTPTVNAPAKVVPPSCSTDNLSVPPICIFNPSSEPLGLAFNIRSSFCGPIIVLSPPLPNVKSPVIVVFAVVKAPDISAAPFMSRLVASSSPLIVNWPPATVRALEECVKVTSPLLKLTTAPDAKKRSDHPKLEEPNTDPSFDEGANLLWFSKSWLTLPTLKVTWLSVEKSIRLCPSLPILLAPKVISPVKVASPFSPSISNNTFPDASPSAPPCLVM